MHSRQAHADMPEGTYEREVSKEGFFGPAAFFHHRHPPTGWSDFAGPLRPRAFDLAALNAAAPSPWDAPKVLGNARVDIRFWKLAAPMPALARNADGDQLLFVHQGAGDLSATTGDWRSKPGTTSICPEARCGGWPRAARRLC
jgi:homogentisate 1,2-dioxygenase